MFNTLLALLQIKKFLSSTFFKIISLISGTLFGGVSSKKIGKKKFSTIRFIFQIFSLFMVPVFTIAFLLPKTTETMSERQTIITMTKEQQEQYLDAIKNGHAVDWNGSLSSSSSGNSSSSPTVTGSVDTNFVLDYDISKLSDIDIKQISDYVKASELLAQQHNIPVTYIYAINLLERSAYELGDGGSGVYMALNPMDKDLRNHNLKYGDVHPVTGKIINYENYGYAEASAHGTTDSNRYRGPFQLDSHTYSGDQLYNYMQSGNLAAGVLLSSDGKSGSLLRTDEYFEGITISSELRGAIAITMHNTGEGGFYSRVPRYGFDARQDFVNVMDNLLRTDLAQDAIKDCITGFGSASQFKSMFTLLDAGGVSITSNAKTKYSIETKTPVFSDMNSVHSNPSDTGGNYKGKSGGYSGAAYKLKLYNMENAIRTVGDNNFAWAFDRESLRYLVGAYSVGNYIEATYNSILKDSTPTGGGGIFKRIINRVKYYWTDEDTMKNVYNKPTKPLEGLFNEVGYKGTFPIFIQGSSLNDVSKTPWKFQGTPTTIGASGCSLFTLTSLIHGVGFGQDPIPITTNGVDGLNDYGYISLQEMAQALPNGPIVADDVSSLGYIVKTVPTTDEGLEELYSYLKQGIPFAVNVRYGDITGYDYNYNKHTVHFTNEGHFLLLVGAYELNGQRFVEVVQSTYSNGGQAKADQNTLIFDFDELKNKKIIRSGSGYPVPAYTITGMRGSTKQPYYMQSEYVTPTRVEVDKSYESLPNDTVQSNISINTFITEIKETGYIKLPETAQVEVSDTYVDIYLNETTYLRISNFEISNMIQYSSEYEVGTFIGSVNNDTIYEHYEGDVLITQ